jgi:hypothetical protein
MSRLVRIDDSIHQILLGMSAKYGISVGGLTSLLIALGLLVLKNNGVIDLDEEEEKAIMRMLGSRLMRIYLEARSIQLAKKLQAAPPSRPIDSNKKQ